MAKAVDLSKVEDKNNSSLEQGNYVATVVNVEYKPLDNDGKGNYINVDFDITEGPLTGYASGVNQSFGWWPLTISISLKESVAWKFKQFIKAMEGYDYEANCKDDDWDEHSIEGCDFGISVQMEHYIKNNGNEGTRIRRWGDHVYGSVADARANKLKLVEDYYDEASKALNTAVGALMGDSMAQAEADNPFA